MQNRCWPWSSKIWEYIMNHQRASYVTLTRERMRENERENEREKKIRIDEKNVQTLELAISEARIFRPMMAGQLSKKLSSGHTTARWLL